MPTFLTTRKMSPALRERVEASARGRKGTRTAPARFRATVRLLFAVSVVVTIVYTFAHRRTAERELERRRTSLLEELRVHASSIDPKQRGAVMARGEPLLRTLAGAYEGDEGDFHAQDALARPLVYVRGPIESFAAGASIEKTAATSELDAFVRCLFDPPRTRKERDVSAKVRAAYTATPPPDVHRLVDVYVTEYFLQPSFEARVRAAGDEELAKLERDFDRAHLGEAKKALAAPFVLAVMDEPGDPKVPADLDGERPHEVRVALFDTTSSKVLLRARKRVDPSGWSQAARADFASGLDSCALAFDLRKGPAAE